VHTHCAQKWPIFSARFLQSALPTIPESPWRVSIIDKGGEGAPRSSRSIGIRTRPTGIGSPSSESSRTWVGRRQAARRARTAFSRHVLRVQEPTRPARQGRHGRMPRARAPPRRGARGPRMTPQSAPAAAGHVTESVFERCAGATLAHSREAARHVTLARRASDGLHDERRAVRTLIVRARGSSPRTDVLLSSRSGLDVLGVVYIRTCPHSPLYRARSLHDQARTAFS